MKNEFDRIIIGGGAAGLFAAGWAAQNGERVLVLERREAETLWSPEVATTWAAASWASWSVTV